MAAFRAGADERGGRAAIVISRLTRIFDSERAVAIVNRVQIGAWTLLACALLPSSGHFRFDEAAFYNQAWRAGKGEIFPVLGPMISKSKPMAYTPGGAFFIIGAVPFVVFDDPRAGTVWLILLSAASILVLDGVMRGNGSAPALRFFAVLFLTWNFWHTLYSDRIWNAHLFWSVSILLLAAVLRAIGRGMTLPCAAAIGLLAGIACQVHLGGLLAVAICAVLLARFGSGTVRDWRRGVAMVAAAGALTYLPYLLSEAGSGFPHTRNFFEGQPPRSFSWAAVGEGLLAPVRFFSHYTHSGHVENPRHAVGSGHLFQLRPASVLQLTGYAGAVLLALAAVTEWRTHRWLVLGLALAIPLYFAAIGRGYFDHYVASVMPYCALVPALGAAALVKKEIARGAVCAFALFFAGTGVFFAVDHYARGRSAFAVPAQMARTRAMLGGEEKVEITIPEAQLDAEVDELFVYHILAKNVLKKELVVTVK